MSRTWTPPAADSLYGVPSASVSAAIQSRLAAPPPAPLTADSWRHVKKLYGSFGNSLLWLDDKGVHQPRVRALLLAIANADSDALSLDAYPLGALASALDTIDAKGSRPSAEQLARADVLLSASFAALGENLLTGQLDPASLNQNWHINPREERVDSALVLTLREDDLAGGLARMRPQDPGYDSLRVAFARFRDLVSTRGWDSLAVPGGKILKRGDSAPASRLDALRVRLSDEGFLGDSPATPGSARGDSSRVKPSSRGANVYDAALAGGVARFQSHHGIVVDSMLGKETVDAMNVPARYRLAQIAANLERYRWLPRTLGRRYILVNVPEFRLKAVDSDEGDSLEMKVIVGQEYQDKATPVFSDSMQFVVFRPYWNVTPEIAQTEIFPKMQADSGYLAANDMEIYDDHGRSAVRQKPGPKNSLGLVKFMFPNDFNVYLHDTPDGQLFKNDVRAFSHGCIRVEKPAQLAQWVLGWNAERVTQAMQNGPDNHQVSLPSKIPVYIVYFTAYVRGGDLYFGNDLYARDGAVVDRLASVAASSPETVRAQQTLRALAR
ncbi:MAG TPA: L,D-transpeptidase family protein [Gemmatimonadaceae bacterium]|nr:L,D-transpeptidase family protein [Gemmatimonadaceae bacterium]